MKTFLIGICFLLTFVTSALAQAPAPAKETSIKPLPSIQEKTRGMEKFPGFFADYWDAREGKIWLEVDNWNKEFLYVESLPNGVGSNDIGLDRGQPGEIQVVHFERSGPRVLLVADNEGYRAVTDDADQRRAVREADAPVPPPRCAPASNRLLLALCPGQRARWACPGLIRHRSADPVAACPATGCRTRAPVPRRRRGRRSMDRRRFPGLKSACACRFRRASARHSTESSNRRSRS